MSFTGINVNVVDLCRLCLGKDESLIPVFDSLHPNQILCDKINVCLAIEISADDKISQQICASCLTKVDSFYEFRNTSSKSQRLLEQWLQDSEAVLKDMNSEEPDINDKGLTSDNSVQGSSVEDGSENESESSSEEDSSSEEESENSQEQESRGVIEMEVQQQEIINSLPVIEAPGPSGLQPNHNEQLLENACSSATEIYSIQSNCESTLENKLHGNGINITKPIGGGGLFRFKMPNNYGCEMCGYSSKSKSNLKKHVMRHKKEYKMKCKLCGKGFYSKSRYRDHTIDGTCQHNYFLKCSKCSKRYNSVTRLSEHMQTHEEGFVPNPAFQCESCGKMFQTRRGMMKHITIIHKGLRHKCFFCDKELTCAKSLEIHMKSHTGEKILFGCQVCGKTYSTYKNLAAHEMIHTGQEPYSCDICRKVFTHKSALIIHKRHHTGEKPFKCSFCEKAFVSKSIMKSHEKRHTS